MTREQLGWGPPPERERVALLQLDPTVGDLEGNAALILRAASSALQAGATLAVTSELALSGYPPRDLVLDATFVERCMDTARAMQPALPILLGTPVPRHGPRRLPGNGVVRVQPGSPAREVTRKQLLPTYDVFDEARYFEPAVDPGILRLHAGLGYGVTICEDAWQHAGEVPHDYPMDPIQQLLGYGGGRDHLLGSVNLSSSPFHLHRPADRARVVRRAAVTLGHPYLLCNQVGGNDDLLCDGRSMAVWPDGRVVMAPAWRQGILLVDMLDPGRSRWLGLDGEEDMVPAVMAADEDPLTPETGAELMEALTVAVRDYTSKVGIRQVVLGLSGGIDSAVTAAVAARALGGEQVLTLSMPSRHSSQHSIDDAAETAEALGTEHKVLPIDGLHGGVEGLLAGELTNGAAVAGENVQARLRGLLVMAHANARGAMALAAGNKSELAQGYCTLYGDMAGGYAPLGDVFKGEVYAIARALNAEATNAGRTPPIPHSTLTKPPSAELAPDQKDEDSLPPYAVLDAILRDHIEHGLDSRQLIEEAQHDPTIVAATLRLLAASEHKRRQMPPAPRVSNRAFGQGWRQPVAAKRA